MQQVVTTINEVKVVAEGSSSLGPWTKSAAVCADGNEYATFDGRLASKATSLVGQPVTLSFETSQRGKYTNLDLKDVEAASSDAVQAPVAAPAAASKSDQFRSKEELRRTAALELAITAFGVAAQDPISQTPEVYELAEEYALFLSQADGVPSE
jgi:hypothetical protein